MRPITVSCGPFGTASANSIALSQSTPGPGAALTLNGSAVNAQGVAVLSPPARVVITSAGNDANLTWSIFGFDMNGRQIGEQIAGANAVAVTSDFIYSSVTSIVCSGKTASTVTAGNTNSGQSPWIRLDDWADAPLGIQVVVNGTVNFTVQHSFDDPNDLFNPVAPANMFWDSGLVPAGAIGGTAGITFSMATAPVWMRIIMGSGTGSVRLTALQYNVVEG